MEVQVRGAEGAPHSLRVDPSLSLGEFRQKLQELGVVKDSDPASRASRGSYRLVVVHAGGDREAFSTVREDPDSKAFRLGEGGHDQEAWTVQRCGLRELDTVLVLPPRAYPSQASARSSSRGGAAKGGVSEAGPTAGGVPESGARGGDAAAAAAAAAAAPAAEAGEDVKMVDSGGAVGPELASPLTGASSAACILAPSSSSLSGAACASTGAPAAAPGGAAAEAGATAEEGRGSSTDGAATAAAVAGEVERAYYASEECRWRPTVTPEAIDAAIAVECGRRGMPFPSSASAARQARHHAQSQVNALAAILAMAGQPGLVEAAMVEVVPEPALIQQLQDMGFGASAARRALALNRNVVEAAVEWLLSHGPQEEDDDEDEEEEVEEEEDEGDEEREGDDEAGGGGGAAPGRAEEPGPRGEGGGAPAEGSGAGEGTGGSQGMDVDGAGAEGGGAGVPAAGGVDAGGDTRSTGEGAARQASAGEVGHLREGRSTSANEARGPPPAPAGREGGVPPFLLPRGGSSRGLGASRAEAVAALEAVLRAGEEEGLADAEDEEVESLMLEQLHAELEAAAGGAAGRGGAGREEGVGGGRGMMGQAAALAAAAAAAGLNPGVGRDAASPADLELMLREVSRMFQHENGVLERFLAELRAARGPGPPS